MIKILTIVGARPQFIKVAPVSIEFSKEKNVQEIIIHTGQHFDKKMSDIFFNEMSLPIPKYNLEIGGGSHGSNTGKMLEKIENVLLEEKPDCVLVYGDTNSTLAGALAASKLHIPVMHVEAGIRSFNRRMPEEINRLLTDHISEICFAPTTNAVSNLEKEGIEKSKIIMSDDVMADASRIYGEISNQNSEIIDKLNLRGKPFILATIHRAENTDNKEILESILSAFGKVKNYKNIEIILPIHPRTMKAIELNNLTFLLEYFTCIDPVGFLDMISLEKHASLIVTDSGGVQKEAFFNNTKCITVRTETEWVELVNCGWNTLVDPHDPEKIYSEIIKNLEQQFMPNKPDLYGNGYAAKEIVKNIINFLSKY